MLTPSLTLLLCLVAPLLALWQSRINTREPYRIYALAAVPLCIATVLSTSAPRVSPVNTSTLMGNISVTPEPQVYLWCTAPLLLAVMALWLLRRLSLPRTTRWLAVPLSSSALGASLALFALPYLSGMLKWSYAALPVKIAGLAGTTLLAAAALAALAFIVLLATSLIKRR